MQRRANVVVVAIVLTLSMLFTSCAALPMPPSPTPAPTTQDVPSPTPPGPTVAPSPTAISTPHAQASAATPRSTVVTIDELFENTARARHLAAKGPVPLGVLTRDELRPYLIQTAERDNVRDDVEKAQALYVLLGLLDPQDDLYTLWLDLMTEQVAGFYDPEVGEMKLITDAGVAPRDTRGMTTIDELTLVHEYTHALQDQHFNLRAKTEEVEHHNERAMAFQALGEGDATLAMIEYARQHKTVAELMGMADTSGLDSQKLAAAPFAIQVEMLFPYEYGLSFASSILKNGGWAALDRAYETPPISTEQIMHPNKYLAAEEPRPVELPDLIKALGPPWSLVETNDFGELGWLIFLANSITTDEAQLAATGWGGDRYALLKGPDGDYALAMLVTWDTANDLEQFRDAARDALETDDSRQVTQQRDGRVVWTDRMTSGILATKDQAALLVVAPDPTTAARIAGAFAGF